MEKRKAGGGFFGASKGVYKGGNLERSIFGEIFLTVDIEDYEGFRHHQASRAT